MKLGIKTAPQHISWQRMRDLWVAADAIEVFDSAWSWDHFYPLSGDFDGPNLEGWTSLAALAEATSRIRIGVQVTGMIYRHPAVLANMAATVDIVSDGRLELGLGAGWNEMETKAYGIPLPPLKERFDRFDEGVQVIISLLSRELTDFDGAYVTLTRARCEPKPVQRPHPPITIGGRGPKRTLLAAAKWAQQWNAISPLEDWAALRRVLHEHCATVGRDPSEIVCSTNVFAPADGEYGPMLEQVAAFREAGADLIVTNLPQGAEPAMLEPLAAALSTVA